LLSQTLAKPACRFVAAALVLSLSSLAQGAARARVPEPAREAPGSVLAALADLSFDGPDVKQGLPHNSVYDFAQDSRGLMWIATFGGLARYDGYRLRTYLHDASDPSSLPDNNVRLLLANPQGGLWLGTGNAGVIVYDPATDSFHPLDNMPAALRHAHVLALAPDHEGGLWFGSPLGLAHYVAAEHRYEVFARAAGRAAADGFDEGSVFSIYQDRANNLWVGGDNGLEVKRAGSTRFEPVPGVAGPGQVGEHPSVWTIFEDHESRLWIGTDVTGLGVVDRAQNRIVGYPRMAGLDSLVGPHTVRGMVEVRKDEFWIATYGDGLIIFHPGTGQAHRYQREVTASAPLRNDFIRGIYLDKTGVVWLGTDRGVSRVNALDTGLLSIHSAFLRSPGLEGGEVRSVAAQGDRIWVGMDKGAMGVIEPDGQIRAVQPAAGVLPGQLSAREILSIKPADPGTVYAGGVGLFEIDTRRLTYRPVPSPLLAKQLLNAVLVDGNQVWAATYKGLVCYDRVTHSSRLYAHVAGDPSSLSDDYVRDLFKASDGQIWITTRLGLDRFEAKTGTFQHIRHDPHQADSIPDGNMQPLGEDNHGRLWIGTMGEGLTILWNWTPDGKPHFRTLTRAQGFPDELALSVMRGKDGRMWSNTPEGLAVIDPDTLKIHTYINADGLRETAQNLFSSATLSDGTIVFPGDEGLIVVRPQLLRERMAGMPRLALTHFTVPGREESPAALAFGAADHGITLEPSQRAFQAGFALLDYSAPEAVRYSYKLEGFDRSWNRVDPDMRRAAYTNLPPGHYRLLIRASMRTGESPPAELDIPILALAPWYQTPWFTVLSALGILTLVLLAVRGRTSALRKRQVVLEREVNARTAELNRKGVELMQLNEQLELLATRDALTGILNRRRFLELAEAELERVRGVESVFTLLLIDVDHFKAINDLAGHAGGDEVLRTLATQLTHHLRRHDILARYGGEELVVLLPETGLDDGVLLAERLLSAVAGFTLEYEEQALTVTISVGAAEADGSEGIDAILGHADAALYAAKRGGRNRVVRQMTRRGPVLRERRH
jgi:diguanylate cyclase (GGDEF)-like protein